MAWPVNLAMGRNVLRYATAQLLCKLPDANSYVFFAWPGIPAEFVFAERDGDTIEAPDAQVNRTTGTVHVTIVTPATRVAIRLRNPSGEMVEIVVLSREQALNLWKISLGGKERLLLSPAQLYADGDKLVLQSVEPSQLKAGPSLRPHTTFLASRTLDEMGSSVFMRLASRPIALTANIAKIQEPGPDPPPKMGKEVVLVPDESAFDSAARWSIGVPELKSDTVSEVFLKVTYQGDIARIYAGGKLITDNFYKGSPWIIGLSAIPQESLKKAFELRILPLRDHAAIYLPSGALPAIPSGGQIAHLQEVQIVPEYRAAMEITP